MPVRRRPAALAALVAAALASAALAQDLRVPKVELDYDKDVDFAAFKTFSWKDPLEAAKDPQMHTRIVWYVERELEKKGLAKKPEGEGDLFVRYYAKARRGFKGTPTQSESYLSGAAGRLTTSVDFSKVVEGTLLLELQRAADGKAVWRAGSGYGSLDKKRLDADTARAVRLLLSKYPPPPSP
ncbi:MAG TPA: DUF4136 domain-containing protein [Vicinamibacteria bacterium]|nr:DUF4136 domain-containing protein [Vicinamibacteria bacterium]